MKTIKLTKQEKQKYSKFISENKFMDLIIFVTEKTKDKEIKKQTEALFVLYKKEKTTIFFSESFNSYLREYLTEITRKIDFDF